jgi:hypothetical protein
MPKRLNAIVPDEMHRALRIALAEDGVDFTEWLKKNIVSYLERKTLEQETKERRERKKELVGESYSYLRSLFEEMAENPALFTREEANIILRRVRGSEDIMPWSLCDYLDLPHGSLYAKGVREFSRDMKAGRILFKQERDREPKGKKTKRKKS